MKAEAKDGSVIYPQVFRKLQHVGALLQRHGYVESARKPNLFVRDYGLVRFYGDLRGTEDVPVWRDQRALFYWFWHPKSGPAPEIRQGHVLLEWVRLSDVPLRLSHELPLHDTDVRSDALLIHQYDYEARRALFVGSHALWGESRFPNELYRREQADLEQVRPTPTSPQRRDPPLVCEALDIDTGEIVDVEAALREPSRIAGLRCLRCKRKVSVHVNELDDERFFVHKRRPCSL